MAKKRIASKNHNHKLRSVEQLTKEEFSKIGKEEWQRCINHVMKKEEQYMKVCSLLNKAANAGPLL